MGNWENKITGYRKEDILDELFLLEGSDIDYITRCGDIYKYSSNTNLYYKRNKNINKDNGYVYVSIRCKKENKTKNKRLHILLAKTFLDNPNGYKIVGHKNNIKNDNRLENLYWTTNQENTQKAFDDKLNIQMKGVSNNFSSPVAVLENDNVVAVYGSMRECSRYIKNLTVGYLAKIIKKNGNYKARSKRYTYKAIDKNEYNLYPENLKYVYLEEVLITKQQTIFRATNNITGNVVISDNQKDFARKYNLEQASVSHAILNNSSYKDFTFELLEKVNYSDSSAYDNFLKTIDGISIKNIKTNEIKSYKTVKDLKDELGIKGNDIRQYIHRGNILMNEWKVLSL